MAKQLKCDYCGAIQDGNMKFVIGAQGPGRELDWLMIYGTGKVTCPKPECHKKGEEEAKAAENRWNEEHYAKI